MINARQAARAMDFYATNELAIRVNKTIFESALAQKTECIIEYDEAPIIVIEKIKQHLLNGKFHFSHNEDARTIKINWEEARNKEIQDIW